MSEEAVPNWQRGGPMTAEVVDTAALAAEIVEAILFDIDRHGLLDEIGEGHWEKLRMEWRRLAENVLRGGA